MRLVLAASLFWATALPAADQCTFWVGIAQEDIRWVRNNPGHEYEDAQRGDLKSAAKAFVDSYAEVKSLMPKVRKEVNDVRSLDQQYWDRWHKYYQACLDYAECMGTSPADCPEPPQQPSGPMPGQQ